MVNFFTYTSTHAFGLTFTALEAAIIVAYSLTTGYGDLGNYYAPGLDPTDQSAESFYPLFQDVQVMMFVGFGFLMTFLRTYSWTAVGINFLISVAVIEMYILAHGFWLCLIEDHWEEIEVSVKTLLAAELCVAATLISFGGVCGKLCPLQLLIMCLIETWFYALNEVIFFDELKAVDVGGSMNIHTFGAYFGLTVAWFVSPAHTKDHPNNSASYNSTLFSWIGTLFLWVYWPSFNGILASGVQRQRAIVNTVLSLTSSTLAAYAGSTFFHSGKFQSEDALNASLAGGVIMGASADIILKPYAALVVGAFAGVLSVVGFSVIQPWLAEKAKLYDTCGINNLHGMPGISGGIVSVLVARSLTDSNTNYLVHEIFPGRSGHDQALMQLAGLGVSIGFGVIGGIFTSAILKLPFLKPPKDLFNDCEFWDMHHCEVASEGTCRSTS